MFNTFLAELKEQLRSKTSFWARIKEGIYESTRGLFKTFIYRIQNLFIFVAWFCLVQQCLMFLEKVTLINKDECGDVDISEETAKAVS